MCISSPADQLCSPRGVVLHEAGPGSNQPTLLLLTDSNNHRVQVFNARARALVRTIGTTGQAGSVKGQFNAQHQAKIFELSFRVSRFARVMRLNGDIRMKAFEADTGTHVLSSARRRWELQRGSLMAHGVWCFTRQHQDRTSLRYRYCLWPTAVTTALVQLSGPVAVSV